MGKTQQLTNMDSVSRKVNCEENVVTVLAQRSMFFTAPALIGSLKQTDPHQPQASHPDDATTPSPYPTGIIDTPKGPARPVPNFRSEGRGELEDMPEEFYTTPEEFNITALTDNKLKEAPTEVIETIMSYFAGNKDVEKLSRVYEQIPLYSSPLVSPGKMKIVPRGTNIREWEFDNIIRLFPQDPYRAGRFFVHGRELEDGTRSHHGVVSATTFPAIAYEALKWKRANKKAPIFLELLLLGEKPGVHYGAEGIAPGINMHPTKYEKVYYEHEVLLSRTNMYKMLSIEKKKDKERGDHILIRIQVTGPLQVY